MSWYDVIIIGTGTAGQTAGYALQSHGLKIAVVEQSDKPGGTCALAGCQAKKWFYEGMETAARAQHLVNKGVEQLPRISWKKLLEEKNRFTNSIPKSTLNGFAKAGIDVLEGQAGFVDTKTIDVDGDKYTANNFIIASGAKPLQLPFAGSEHMITSEQFLELAELPQRIVFVGGGFISFEFAHFVARLNTAENRQTTILEVAERPLGPFDEDMVEQLIIASEMDDIDILTEVKIEQIEQTADGYIVHLSDDETLEADLVVNGAGRQADIDELGLDDIGIEYSRRGITVDKQMQTNASNIYAIGDCAATIQLARVADYEAQIAAQNILNGKADNALPLIDYHTVPSVLFSYPQYGMVGQTEQALKAAGTEYVKSEAYDLGWPSYRRIGMEHAAYKILASPDGQLLGAHFLSDQAAGMVNSIRLAMLNGISVEKLYRQSLMAPYPTRQSDMTYMLKALIE